MLRQLFGEIIPNSYGVEVTCSEMPADLASEIDVEYFLKTTER